MPQGLQVWDENGDLTVDVTTRLTKILGSFTIGTGANSGSMAIDLSQLRGQTFWYNVILLDVGARVGPDLSYSNGVFYWQWVFIPQFYKAPVKVTYGVR